MRLTAALGWALLLWFLTGCMATVSGPVAASLPPGSHPSIAMTKGPDGTADESGFIVFRTSGEARTAAARTACRVLRESIGDPRVFRTANSLARGFALGEGDESSARR